jgi:hypothetical protein
MIPGVMAAQMRVAVGGGTLWTPLNMATVPQIYLDAEDSVVTDVSGACSAISNLGAMGADGDFSQGTAGSRPAIVESGLNGMRMLSFDGVDDRMLTSSTAAKQLFKSVNHAWVFAVFRRAAATTGNTRALVYSTVGTGTAGRFAAWAGFSGNDNKLIVRGQRLDGDAAGTAIVSAVTFSGYTMALCRVNYSTRVAIVEQDAVVRGSGNSPVSAGATSATDALHPIGLCGFPSGAGGDADVDLSNVLLGNTLLSSDDIDKLFGWAAHKYGLTANLPGGHPYKTVAPTV